MVLRASRKWPLSALLKRVRQAPENRKNNDPVIHLYDDSLFRRPLWHGRPRKAVGPPNWLARARAHARARKVVRKFPRSGYSERR